MPIRARAQEMGAFTPEELALLVRVFESTNDPNENFSDREMRASRIITAYMTGVHDEDELVALSKQPLGR